MNNILVTRGDMAKYLIRKGYRVVDISRNRTKNAQTVFYFENTKEVLDAISYFKSTHNI